jgi:hypothetical protein
MCGYRKDSVWVTVTCTGRGLGVMARVGVMLSCSEREVYRSATGRCDCVSWPVKVTTILQNVTKYLLNDIESHHSKLIFTNITVIVSNVTEESFIGHLMDTILIQDMNMTFKYKTIHIRHQVIKLSHDAV